MLEYVNNFFTGTPALPNLFLTLTVTSCQGNTTLLGTHSYEDALTGKLTTLQENWSHDGISVALTDIPHGYFYFAVKNPQGIFRTHLGKSAIFN